MDDLREKVAAALARKRHDYEPDLDAYAADDILQLELADIDTVLAAIHASGHRIVPVEPEPERIEAATKRGMDTLTAMFAYDLMVTNYGQGDKP